MVKEERKAGEPSPFQMPENVRRFVEAHAAWAPEQVEGETDVENSDAAREEVIQGINLRAWQTSLQVSAKEDLARWRLADLAPDQHQRELSILSRGLRRQKVRNLLLVGDTGPGKTTTAIALGWAAVEQGMSARIIDHSKFCRWTQTSESMPGYPHPYWDISREQFINRMTTCDFLVLDDLGRGLSTTTDVSEHVLKVTTELIEDRIDTPGKVTVITTNHPSKVLRTMFGDAFVSRLGKAAKSFKFEGPDRREPLDW